MKLPGHTHKAGGKGGQWGGRESAGVSGTGEGKEAVTQRHYVHVWKCQNESHYYVWLVCANKNVLYKGEFWSLCSFPTEQGSHPCRQTETQEAGSWLWGIFWVVRVTLLINRELQIMICGARLCWCSSRLPEDRQIPARNGLLLRTCQVNKDGGRTFGGLSGWGTFWSGRKAGHPRFTHAVASISFLNLSFFQRFPYLSPW